MRLELAPYEVLGVDPSASLAEVTASYKILAQIFHPDRFHGASEPVRLTAEAKMKELNDAYAAARKGSLVLWPGTARNGTAPPPSPTNHSPGRPRPHGTGEPAWVAAQRARATQAARVRQARVARERESTNGTAVARPRQDLAYRGSILLGLGMARFTGNLICPGCQAVQWLPPEWRELLDENAFFCSVCDRPILARVKDSAPRVGKED